MMIDGLARVAVQGWRGVQIMVILGVLPAFITTGLYVLLFWNADFVSDTNTNTTDSRQIEVDDIKSYIILCPKSIFTLYTLQSPWHTHSLGESGSG